MKWLKNLFVSKKKNELLLESGKENDSNIKSQLTEALNLLMQNRNEEALMILDSFKYNQLDESSNFTKLQFCRTYAECLKCLSYHEEALHYFNLAINFAPNDYTLYFSRSFSKSLTFDLEGAVNDIEKAIHFSTLDAEYDNANDMMFQYMLKTAKSELKLFKSLVDKIDNSEGEHKSKLEEDLANFKTSKLSELIIRKPQRSKIRY